MTVKDLIQQLGTLSPEKRVILSSDAEGNSFVELDQFGIEDTDAERIVLYPSHATTVDLDET